MQLDKFTLKSQEAIQAAQGLAQSGGNQELQPEHLVKAILEQPEGVVVPVLQKMGVTPSVVLAETNQLIAARLGERLRRRPDLRLPAVSRPARGELQDRGHAGRVRQPEHLFLTILADRLLKVTALGSGKRRHPARPSRR